MVTGISVTACPDHPQRAVHLTYYIFIAFHITIFSAFASESRYSIERPYLILWETGEYKSHSQTLYTTPHRGMYGKIYNL